MDKYRDCQLKDVRLEGVPGEKMDRFLQFRVLSDFAKKDIFGEARSPIERRDDDEGMPAGGMWRGEFWGKLMLSAARVADYTQDAGLLKFIQDECHRLMALQDDDGYLGSYTDKERVAFTEETGRMMDQNPAFGWHCLWNLWNRKYLIWAMLMVAKVTKDQAIMDSVVRQMDQWIDMMHRLGIPLYVTGNDQIMGVASMSVLKPLVMLYEETKNKKYLDYAAEMLPDWDREDGKGPNFFRNAFNGKELWQWYPNAAGWAKSYEMMSCLDGLLEYYRVTGEKRCLDAVAAIHENLAKSELNPIGDVGFVDKFIGAAHYPNAATELCDTIHWIRLSYDLFLITGDDKYLDYMEFAYFNAFLAGVYRDGSWAAFSIRAATRHEPNFQCNCAYNHCCVNNVPRTFMDMASATVVRDQDGVFQVNFYQDATATLDGVTFKIRGNYPVGNIVTVTVSVPQAGLVPETRCLPTGECLYADVRHGAAHRQPSDGQHRGGRQRSERLAVQALPMRRHVFGRRRHPQLPLHDGRDDDDRPARVGPRTPRRRHGGSTLQRRHGERSHMYIEAVASQERPLLGRMGCGDHPRRKSRQVLPRVRLPIGRRFALRRPDGQHILRMGLIFRATIC